MFLNVAAYHFSPLNNLNAVQADLRIFCEESSLKGTILLTPEGVNLFVAGQENLVRGLLTKLRSIEGLSDLQAKESWSDKQPFNRMIVKIKKETISFGVDQASPLHTQTKRITPKELKAWYDENRDFVLLDTRNDFEIKLGAFDNTTHFTMKSFKDFIEAAPQKLAEWQDKPIVTVCTGGIRCEKAAPFMQLTGFKNVYQLEGGILKYFEEIGGEHYHGDCFVFDKRVALTPELKPSGHALCFDCRGVLNSKDEICNHPSH